MLSSSRRQPFLTFLYQSPCRGSKSGLRVASPRPLHSSRCRLRLSCSPPRFHRESRPLPALNRLASSAPHHVRTTASLLFRSVPRLSLRYCEARLKVRDRSFHILIQDRLFSRSNLFIRRSPKQPEFKERLCSAQ